MKPTADQLTLLTKIRLELLNKGFTGNFTIYSNDSGATVITPENMDSDWLEFRLGPTKTLQFCVCALCGNTVGMTFSDTAPSFVSDLMWSQFNRDSVQTNLAALNRILRYSDWAYEVLGLCPTCQNRPCAQCGRKLNRKTVQPNRLNGFRNSGRCEGCRKPSISTASPPKLPMASRKLITKLARRAYEIPKA